MPLLFQDYEEKAMGYEEFVSLSGQAQGRPERLVMVLDCSSSMADTDWRPTRLTGAKQAAVRLVKIKESSFGDDEVGVVSFSDEAETVQPPVEVRTGAGQIKRSISRISPLGSTNMSAGLKEAEHLLSGQKTSSPSGGVLDHLSKFLYGEPQAVAASASGVSKRVIFLTDGHHNATNNPARVTARLKQAGVVIDCIGIGGSPSDVNEARLKAMASRNPDGSIRYAFIGDAAALIRKFEQLGNRLRTA